MESDMRRNGLTIFAIVLVAVALAAPAVAQDEEFKGKIGTTLADSEQYWPEPVTPPEGAPNVLIWLIDDMGYGHSSAFGGLTPMPAIERLAERGLRFNNFHTTALCSPSRAAIAAGRNHHNIGMGSHSLTAMAKIFKFFALMSLSLRFSMLVSRYSIHPPTRKLIACYRASSIEHRAGGWGHGVYQIGLV
jgi:hypothetical protein